MLKTMFYHFCNTVAITFGVVIGLAAAFPFAVFLISVFEVFLQ